MASTTSVALTPEQAFAACSAIGQAIAALDLTDCNTWHNGLGSDLCGHCGALAILRPAADVAENDWRRA